MHDSDYPVPYHKREVMITVRLPNDQRERLRSEAEALGTSMNELAKTKLARLLPVADAERIRSKSFRCTNQWKTIAVSADPTEVIDWL